MVVNEAAVTFVFVVLIVLVVVVDVVWSIGDGTRQVETNITNSTAMTRVRGSYARGRQRWRGCLCGG